jgi:hypothetical protein
MNLAVGPDFVDARLDILFEPLPFPVRFAPDVHIDLISDLLSLITLGSLELVVS